MAIVSMVMPTLQQHRTDYEIDILSLFITAETAIMVFHSLALYSFEFTLERKPAGLLNYGVVKDMGEDSQVGAKEKIQVDHDVSKISKNPVGSVGGNSSIVLWEISAERLGNDRDNTGSLDQYLRDKMKIMAKETSPLTNIVWCEGNQVQTAVAQGAVYHGIQASSQSYQPIVQVNGRASGEGHGLESSADRSILSLVNPGGELSAGGHNRRPIPPQAVWQGRDGCFYVNMYRQEGPDAIPGFASCLSWNAVGGPQNLEFQFSWDGTQMHYVLLYQGNQQVPLTIENYYDL